MVVLQHVAYVVGLPAYWSEPGISRMLAGTALGVEFFFVLSGFVILMAHWKDVGHPSTVLSYVWKRFRRIYPIYWVVLAVWLPLYLHFSHMHDPAYGELLPMLSNLLLVHLHSLFNAVAVAWTLFHEILFYGIFAVILFNRRLGAVIFGLWIFGSFLMLFFPASAWLRDYFFSPLHLLFAWGHACGVAPKNTGRPWGSDLAGIRSTALRRLHDCGNAIRGC
jgi:exopolysaccharide production protein ExoZ